MKLSNNISYENNFQDFHCPLPLSKQTVVGAFGVDAGDLEPTGRGIDHGKGMQFDANVLLAFLRLFTKFVGTDKVDTECVPCAPDSSWEAVCRI